MTDGKAGTIKKRNGWSHTRATFLATERFLDGNWDPEVVHELKLCMGVDPKQKKLTNRESWKSELDRTFTLFYSI